MSQPELYDDLAYSYDGSLEGLLSAIFAAYERHEHPRDIAPEGQVQLRLGQQLSFIPTDRSHALRVQRGLCGRCGEGAFNALKYAFLSDEPQAGTFIYEFVRYAMDSRAHSECSSCSHKNHCSGICTRRPSAHGIMSQITHPKVEPIFRLARAVDNERHHMLQFLRFEALEGNLWYARCNPKASVVPLIMDHFSGRFNTQSFIIHDEVHQMAGVYSGKDWYLVDLGRDSQSELNLPPKTAMEDLMAKSWRRFYRKVAVESRYNPELRRQFMPVRLWKNLTEMQVDLTESF